jgi:hypothetical protein
MIGSQAYPKLLDESLSSGGRRWIDVGDSPFSRAATYKAIKLGLFDSVIVQFPGSKRRRRFIDALSINRYFEKLMKEQKRAVVTEMNTRPIS